MAYAQRYNPERDVMELVDTDTGQLVMSSPIAPLTQDVLKKYQAFPAYPSSAQAQGSLPTPLPETTGYSGRGASGSFDAPEIQTPEATAPAAAQEPTFGFGENPSVARGFDQMREGFAKSQEAMAKAAEESVAIQREYNQAAREEQERIASRERERNESLAKMQQDYKALSDDIRSSRLDPNRWYGNRTTGQKVQTAIGLALSGIADAGAVFAGRGRADHFDRAMGIINQAVERDIEQQKYQIGLKQHAASEKMNVYNMMLRQFGDERDAEGATKLFMLEDAKNRLLETQMRYKAPQIQANTQEMLGKFAIEEQKIQTELSESILARIGKFQEARDKQAEKMRPLEVYDEKGTLVGHAPTEKSAGEARKAFADKATAIRLIDELISIRKKEGGRAGGIEVLPTGTAARAAEIASELRLKIKDLAALGALNASDYAELYSQVPKDPTGYGFVLPKLEQLRSNTIDRTRDIMSTMGLRGKISNVGGRERKL